MAWLNQKLRQRLLGAFVLTALAVIFLPMLLTQEQEAVQVQVEIPDIPNMPAMPEIRVETVTVPESPSMDDDTYIALDKPMSDDDESEVVQEPVANEGNARLAAKTPRTETPVPPLTAKTSESPAKPATKQTPAPSSQPPVRRLDTASLPISWSVQLPSLKNHDDAKKMRDDLRRKGYNAYIRSADGMSKVLVGPLIDLNAAKRLLSELEIKQGLSGFVVRFQP